MSAPAQPRPVSRPSRPLTPTRSLDGRYRITMRIEHRVLFDDMTRALASRACRDDDIDEMLAKHRSRQAGLERVRQTLWRRGESGWPVQVTEAGWKRIAAHVLRLFPEWTPYQHTAAEGVLLDERPLGFRHPLDPGRCAG